MSVTVPEIAGYGELVEIGRGGYSHVYRARQYEFDRPVAIKVLNEPLKDSAAVDSFERECRTMGALWDHPNIVPVFASAFTSDDRPCIVMKLFHEGSYSQVLHNSGPIALQELLVVGVKIAGALAAAHEALVVHGDVKPHNIFKSRFGEPALGDFGIATFAGRRKEGAPLGISVHYAAPEAVDSDLGPGSDQYSLAATLYTLAVGRRPFEASDSTESNSSTDVLHRVITRPTPQLPKQFPEDFRAIIWRAMSRDPGGRFEAISAFGAALSAVAAGLDTRRTRVEPTSTSWPRGTADAAGDGKGGDTSSGDGPQTGRKPRFGAVRLPDGRLEPLDADLVIGRNPAHTPLEDRQRAVVAGEHDRTVSRRHIELRPNNSNVTALVSGNHTRLERQGAVSALAPSSAVELLLGDVLYFGADTWLQYSSSDQSGDSPSQDAPVRDQTKSTSQTGSSSQIEARQQRDAPVRLPSLGTVYFSDGTAEALDADLVIGRRPDRDPLEEHQRAVECGSTDRAVSRRHIELRLNGWEVTAHCRGNKVWIERTKDADSRIVATGEAAPLRQGDILHFGTSSWLRYESGAPRAD